MTATDGVVQDDYTNHSVLVDPATGKPTEPDPNEVVVSAAEPQAHHGVWKVVEVIEETATMRRGVVVLVVLIAVVVLSATPAMADQPEVDYHPWS